MKQKELFDAGVARTSRDQAIEHVSRRQHWLTTWREAIMNTAQTMHDFTSDDVLKRFPQLEHCPENRVAGAAFLGLHREGKIEPSGYRKSTRIKSHARPKRVWRIL